MKPDVNRSFVQLSYTSVRLFSIHWGISLTSFFKFVRLLCAEAFKPFLLRAGFGRDLQVGSLVVFRGFDIHGSLPQLSEENKKRQAFSALPPRNIYQPKWASSLHITCIGNCLFAVESRINPGFLSCDFPLPHGRKCGFGPRCGETWGKQRKSRHGRDEKAGSLSRQIK